MHAPNPALHEHRIEHLQTTPLPFSEFSSAIEALVNEMCHAYGQGQSRKTKTTVLFRDNFLSFTAGTSFRPVLSFELDIPAEFETAFQQLMSTVPGVDIVKRTGKEAWDGNHLMSFDARYWLSIRAALVIEYLDRSPEEWHDLEYKEMCKMILTTVLHKDGPGLSLDVLEPMYGAGIIGSESTQFIGQCLVNGTFQTEATGLPLPIDMTPT